MSGRYWPMSGVQRDDERAGGPLIGRNVQVLDFLADDPRRHRVDIEALHGSIRGGSPRSAASRPP